MRSRLQQLKDIFSDRFESVPTLYPVGQQLAEACRRLGFIQLARAAMPEMDDSALRVVYDKHEAEVMVEAQRRFDFCTKQAQNWDPARMGREFEFETVEQTAALLSFGPFEGKPENKPLRTLDLSTPSQPHEQFTAARVGNRK